MNSIIPKLVSFSSITFCLFACEIDHIGNSLTRIRNCHEDLNRDVEQIKNDIIGEWMWLQSNCVFVGQINIPKDSISFEFRDSLVTISNQGVIFQTSAWDIELNSFGDFVIDLDPSASQFQGEIFLCENEMITRDNLISDGCDHYFQREE